MIKSKISPIKSKFDMEIRCRTCLGNDGALFSIKGEDEVDEVKISHKLASFIPDIVWFGEHLPKFICSKCLDLLTTSFNFRQTCISTNETIGKLLEKLSTSESTVLDGIVKTENPDSENKVNDEEMEISCPEQNSCDGDDVKEEEFQITESGLPFIEKSTSQKETMDSRGRKLVAMASGAPQNDINNDRESPQNIIILETNSALGLDQPSSSVNKIIEDSNYDVELGDETQLQSHSSSSESSEDEYKHSDATKKRKLDIKDEGEESSKRTANKKDKEVNQENQHPCLSTIKRRVGKRAERKDKKRLGLEYISTTGNLVPQKAMKINPCKSNKTCTNECNTFTEEERQYIFEYYWKLGCGKKQKRFLSDSLSVCPVKRRRKSKGAKTRNVTVEYHLLKNEIRRRVCKQFLLATLSITGRLLRTVVENKEYEKSPELELGGNQ